MLTFDFAEFERAARRLGSAPDQVAFAISAAMNDAIKKTRATLIEETWPKYVEVRNRRFLGWALRTEYATKRNLTVEINDARAQGRGHLALHAKGGVKPARGRLAIPSKMVAAQRGSSGVPKRLRPASLKRAVVKENLLFLPEGRGKNAKLRLAFKLRRQAPIKKDVPFVEEFQRVMRAEMSKSLPAAVMKAMSTRR